MNYGTVFAKMNTLQAVGELLRQKLESDSFLPITTETEGKFSCCLMSLIYRWQSFNIGTVSIDKKKISYMRINKKANEMISMNSAYFDTKMYLLPTDDSDVNIFIADNGKFNLFYPALTHFSKLIC